MPKAPKAAPKRSEDDARRAEEEKQRVEAEAEAARVKEEEDKKKHDEEEKVKAEEQRRKTDEDRKRKEEMERQKNREERERKDREVELKLQQLQVLEEKDKEIHQLQDRTIALNHTLSGMQSDLEEQTHRSASLQDELERTQQVLTEKEVEGEQELKKRRYELEGVGQDLLQTQKQLSVTKAESNERESAIVAIRDKFSQEMEALKTEIYQLRSDKDKDDTENTILMKLLHTELDKYKQQSSSLQSDLERKEREDVKNTIMLGLLNSQLDTGKEDAKRLNDSLSDYQGRTESLDLKLQESSDTIQKLHETNKELHQQTRENEDALTRDIELHKAKAEQLAATVARLNEQLDTTKTQYLNFQAEAEKKDKDAFEKNVILKSELEHGKTQFNNLTREKEGAERKAYEKQVQQMSEIEALREKLSLETDRAEKKEKESYERVTLQKSEIETLKAKLEQEKEMLKEKEKHHFESLSNTQSELEIERSGLSQSKAVADRKDKEYFEQITKLTAEQESLHKQVVQLQALNEKKDREYVETQINLNAEKENYRNNSTLLQEELTRREREHSEKEVGLQTEIEQLKRKQTEMDANHDKALAEERNQLELGNEQLNNVSKRVKLLEEEAAKKDKDHWDRSNAYKAEIEALKREVDGYKQTIEKLEGSIAENYNFKILAEQNEQLKSDITSYRNQIGNLNNTISTMKIEADILDNYKTKILQEQNEQYLKRIQELEKEHKMIAPLMSELISTLQKHGLTTSLQMDIEVYKNQFLKAASDYDASKTRTASAMGRHELTPIEK